MTEFLTERASRRLAEEKQDLEDTMRLLRELIDSGSWVEARMRFRLCEAICGQIIQDVQIIKDGK